MPFTGDEFNPELMPDYELNPWNDVVTPPLGPVGGDDGTGSIPGQIANPPLDEGYDPGEWGWASLSPFAGSTRVNMDFGSVPRFSAPRFTAPTAETVVNEPGYALGLQMGQQGLQNAAAAKGVLRTGGSLKDLAAWATNYGGTKYNEAFNRALADYGTQFQAAKSEYEPLLQEWMTNAEGTRAARLAEFQRAFDEWRFMQQLLADREMAEFKYE